ncbi:unnamed protein product [Phytophthora fragariaefolia]|uniref:Unnamed protein product n=1 Tax=Phytophthora fragariaefolia TaxID=1490495 RepID=A0A9W6UEQ3_9STRA|nr:unnamed protein product [Phytophthora fragariaefolia]
MDGINTPDNGRGIVVVRRRRRRRNGAGQYVLEYELWPRGDPNQWATDERNHGLTKGAVDAYAGRAWWNTNGFTVSTGSWKTRALGKTCKEHEALNLDALVGAAERLNEGIEVDGSVAPEPNGPDGRHDRLHGRPARSVVVSPGADLSRAGASLLGLTAGVQGELSPRVAG